MPNRDIIVIGASAGGIEALRLLVRALPKNLQAAIFIVVHTAPDGPGVLHEILAYEGCLPSVSARDWEDIRMGHIYVAPPDRHLLLDPSGYTRLTKGPKENRFRPAVDPLFRSAARAFGSRVVGVVLTGGLDDGTAGLLAIKQCGGLAVVQDPDDALAPSRPLNAVKHVPVDYCLPLAEIAPLLVRLSGEPAAQEGAYPVSEELDIEVKIAKEDKALDAGVMKLGQPSPFTCPECHGTLLQMKEGNFLRFRCHTGHAFSINSLLAELANNVEETLWTAIRSIQESTMLMRHLAQHLSAGGEGAMAELFLQKAQEAERQADLVRQAVISHEKMSEVKDSGTSSAYHLKDGTKI
jgi:two-component system chemotaxis response regulator CheB